MKNQSTKLSTKLIKSKNKNIGNHGYMVFQFYRYIYGYFGKKKNIDWSKIDQIYIYKLLKMKLGV